MRRTENFECVSDIPLRNAVKKCVIYVCSAPHYVAYFLLALLMLQITLHLFLYLSLVLSPSIILFIASTFNYLWTQRIA